MNLSRVNFNCEGCSSAALRENNEKLNICKELCTMMENPGELLFGGGQATSLCGCVTGQRGWCLPGATSVGCVRMCWSASLSAPVLCRANKPRVPLSYWRANVWERPCEVIQVRQNTLDPLYNFFSVLFPR